MLICIKYNFLRNLFNKKKSIAVLLQGYIFEDSKTSESCKLVEFNLVTTLRQEFGGCPEELNETIFNSETCNDPELREKLLEGTIPAVDSIYRYVLFLLFALFT